MVFARGGHCRGLVRQWDVMAVKRYRCCVCWPGLCRSNHLDNTPRLFALGRPRCVRSAGGRQLNVPPSGMQIFASNIESECHREVLSLQRTCNTFRTSSSTLYFMQLIVYFMFLFLICNALSMDAPQLQYGGFFHLCANKYVAIYVCESVILTIHLQVIAVSQSPSGADMD